MSLFGLIVAAGTGTRFASSFSPTDHAIAQKSSENLSNKLLPKQYHKLQGVPMLAYSINVLLAVAAIKSVAVVLHPDDNLYEAHIPKHINHSKTINLFHKGGSTRSQSVKNGLQALNAIYAFTDDDMVLVHDAARPCARLEVICDMAKSLRHHPIGGILATPLADTLKSGAAIVVGMNTTDIMATPNRENLWLAQTPQMFRANYLMSAINESLQSGIECTDEAMAIEWWLANVNNKTHDNSGNYVRPVLFRGSKDNIKVTFAEDLPLAEAILTAQKNQMPIY